MYRLDANRLEEADILLTRDKASVLSWAVRAGTFSPVSHAALYVGGHSYIDADAGGVHANNLQRLVFPRNRDVVVMRSLHPLTRGQTDAVCSAVRLRAHELYSVGQAVASAVPRLRRKASDREFCSRLIARAYAEAGVPMSDDPDFMTPGALRRSKRLREVEHVVVRATPDEVAFASERDTPLVQQERIVNALFAEVGRLSCSTVSTFQDLVGLLVARPNLNPDIAAVLRRSGYLDMSRWDLERAPHWYDAAVLSSLMPADELEAFAVAQLDVERRTAARHATSLAALQAAYRSGAEAIEVLMELERTLIELSATRAGVLSEALSRERLLRG